MKTPDKVLVSSEAAVALTTASFPFITGYGTVLFQVVALGAWGILARLTSGRFADLHHSVLWAVALILNVLIFSIVAVPIWAVFRSARGPAHRQPKVPLKSFLGGQARKAVPGTEKTK